MWRHRFLIKGSEQELAWLNAQAQATLFIDGYSWKLVSV